jgi:HK97 family phage major capsid protein
MSYANSLKDQAIRIEVQIQNLIDTAKKENNRPFTSVEREQYHKLEADHSAIEESIKIANKSSLTTSLEKPKVSELSATEVEEIKDTFRLSEANKRAKTPYEKAFSNYLKSASSRHPLSEGDKELLFKNTMSTTTGSQGGYLIPQGFSDMLEEAKKYYYCMAGVAEHFKTATGNTMPWPTLNDTSNAGTIIAQNTQVAETDLVFGSVNFSAYILQSGLVLAPLALIEDSYFDLDALVAKNLGIRLGRGYNNYTTTGTGSSQPTGIVTAVANGGSGNIVTAGGSSSSGETSTITYTDLVNLEGAVDPAYRENPQTYWMFNDSMLKVLKQLVDGNSRPLWQPGLTASFINGASVADGGVKPRILDHPYIINQSMASPAASAYSMIFGDLSCFKVRELASGTEVMILNERYADYLQRGFIAFQRFDSNYVNAGTNPIAVLKQSAT